MEWARDRYGDAEHSRRVALLRRRGLLCRVRAERSAWGLYQLTVVPERGFVPLARPHACRRLHSEGWRYHVSLGMRVEPSLWRRLRGRYRGQRVRLRVSWVGSGAAAFLGAGPVASDPLVVAAHGAGEYADRALHVSL